MVNQAPTTGRHIYIMLPNLQLSIKQLVLALSCKSGVTCCSSVFTHPVAQPHVRLALTRAMHTDPPLLPNLQRGPIDWTWTQDSDDVLKFPWPWRFLDPPPGPSSDWTHIPIPIGNSRCHDSEYIVLIVRAVQKLSNLLPPVSWHWSAIKSVNYSVNSFSNPCKGIFRVHHSSHIRHSAYCGFANIHSQQGMRKSDCWRSSVLERASAWPLRQPLPWKSTCDFLAIKSLEFAYENLCLAYVLAHQRGETWGHNLISNIQRKIQQNI